MTKPITISEYMTSGPTGTLIDVRTPAEFAQGHIPGAFNIPLFSNEERVIIGTTYKQESREAAILSGFDLTGPKWSGFIRSALAIAPNQKVVLHCWRGGMRSGAMAWALGLYGFEVSVITGGYKNYRRWVHRQFEPAYRLSILGGMTGSGKTRILQQIRAAGEQVLDLEDLAQHRGSAYGSMNAMLQPSQEQFENNLADCLVQMDPQRTIWVEDESLSIGKRSIPKIFWLQMRAAALIEIRTNPEERIAALVRDYGTLDPDFLVESTERIRKRLGPEQTKQAIEAIREQRMADFVRLVLVYYDKTYRTGMAMRDASRVYPVVISGGDDHADAQQILDFNHIHFS